LFKNQKLFGYALPAPSKTVTNSTLAKFAPHLDRSLSPSSLKWKSSSKTIPLKEIVRIRKKKNSSPFFG
jgi:hypothetical protein